MSDEKNETQKAEQDQRKERNIQEILGGMDQNEQMVLSYFIHTSLQKGRLIGWKEKEGVSAKEIADILSVPEDVVQKALDEDPYDILGIAKQ
jgi:DNA-directed RNA polymerase specialized sigma subunit